MGQILANHYVLAVHDLDRSAAFYRDVLGFAEYMRPDGWVFMKRDNVMVMMGLCTDAIPPGELGDHSYFGYLRVDDADAFYETAKAKGAEIVMTLASKPWGMREFGLRTVDGHRIMVGHVIE